MPKKNNVLHEEQQAKLIELLNRRLADAIDLQLQSRQTYWNVTGPHFMALRELLDQVAQGGEEDANLIVQLGGRAGGAAQTVADIFTQIARGSDTWLWFVQTSQQADS